MTQSDIALRRLHNQHLARPGFERPEDEVAWMGAVQAQDYYPAQWALGLRVPGATEARLEAAFTEGALLRTHLMRPTWHFVAPADIRWLLALTAPRVHALNAPYYRKCELDDALFARCHDVLTEALQGGRQRTRNDLRGDLQRAGIDPGDTMRMSYIMMQAELEGLICSGPRRGKQFTYMLLEERVLPARPLDRDEALVELTRRFFTSHGPATEYDFAKWSGLTVTDARRGLDALGDELERAEVDGQTYRFSSAIPATPLDASLVHLIPALDEYTVGYKDHRASFDAAHLGDLSYGHILILNGRVAGTWKRTLTKHTVHIAYDTFTPLTNAETRAVEAALHRFGAFLGRDVVAA